MPKSKLALVLIIYIRNVSNTGALLPALIMMKLWFSYRYRYLLILYVHVPQLPLCAIGPSIPLNGII